MTDVEWVNEKTRQDLAEYGWHRLGIERDETTPACAHTIGLHETFNHPEIVVLGLPVKRLLAWWSCARRGSTASLAR